LVKTTGLRLIAFTIAMLATAFLIEAVATIYITQILEYPRIHTYDRELGWRLLPNLDARRVA